MAILFYTTSIATNKTANEIQLILAEGGALAVMAEFEGKDVSAISFRADLNGQVLSFKLPVNAEGVYRVMKADSDIPFKLKTMEQAKRTAWRIVKGWIVAQMALVEAEQAELTEVFFPYLQDNSGVTVYNKIRAGNLKLLE